MGLRVQWGMIVGLQRCNTYRVEDLLPVLRRAVADAGGFDMTGKRVLLKPNILRDAPPERAITTHPEFLRAVIRLTREVGATQVLVGDSPGVHRSSFDGRTSGLREIVETEGAEWVDFTAGEAYRHVPDPYEEPQFALTDVVDRVDAIVSVAKLKTHELMLYTGAMKNLYGLLPGFSKARLHVRHPGREEFGRMLVDLVRAVRPAYAFMDGVVAMEGPGPGNGYARAVGVVAASPSTLALDVVMSRLIGYDPERIATNRFGWGRLDGIASPADVEVRGVTESDLTPRDFQLIGEGRRGLGIPGLRVPGFLKQFGLIQRIETRLRPHPVFDHDACIRCGECVQICASKALRFVPDESEAGRHVAIDTRACIRCYCCHEVCPVNAIAIPGR